jgi:hypothetical protein
MRYIPLRKSHSAIIDCRTFHDLLMCWNMYISHLFVVVTFYGNLFPPRSFSYISDDRGRRFSFLSRSDRTLVAVMFY